MTELVPIRIKIGRVFDGRRMVNAYPNFNQIDPEIRKNLDWSFYFDTHGLRWHYDKACGFGEVDEESPDMQFMFGATCVLEDFAEEALKLWGPNGTEVKGLVTRMSEAEWEQFYDVRAHAHEPTEKLDTEVLQGIAARVALENDPNVGTILVTAELRELRRKCLDPDEQNHFGIRKNLDKTWKLKKAKLGVTIK